MAPFLTMRAVINTTASSTDQTTPNLRPMSPMGLGNEGDTKRWAGETRIASNCQSHSNANECLFTVAQWDWTMWRANGLEPHWRRRHTVCIQSATVSTLSEAGNGLGPRIHICVLCWYRSMMVPWKEKYWVIKLGLWQRTRTWWSSGPLYIAWLLSKIPFTRMWIAEPFETL